MYENGYENVSVLLGGYRKWIEAGYPVDESYRVDLR
jgi:3-mercaptopyruvate sulfurtransferase SseA